MEDSWLNTTYSAPNPDHLYRYNYYSHYNGIDRDTEMHRLHTSQSLPPMQRYLQDHERSFFSPRYAAEYGGSHMLDTLPPYYSEPARHATGTVEYLSSPSGSAPASSHNSSEWSDQHITPMSSPGPIYSPEIASAESLHHGYSGHFRDHRRSSATSSCVAPHAVQLFADAQPDKDVFEDDHGVYCPPYPEEGYEPMQHIDYDHDSPAPNSSHTSSSEEYRPVAPNIRSRKPPTARALTQQHHTSKVAKPANGKKRSASQHSEHNGHANKAMGRCGLNGAFPCPLAVYGCNSTFSSKNEWKRHVNTQHMRLGFWRCDQCDNRSEKPNDFNRKDLFIQHVRRMHPSNRARASNNATTRSGKNDRELQEDNKIATRCYQRTRAPPKRSGCMFCEVTFSGVQTWDDRLEHVGKHMESMKKESSSLIKLEDWHRDQGFEEWLTHHGIIEQSGKGYVLAC